MKQLQSGRTLVETLAVLCVIGIFSVSGLHLYAKAMTTIRANYIMQQVFIKANELIESPVSNRRKSVDLSVHNNDSKLSYGYEFDNSGSCRTAYCEPDIFVTIKGYFSVNLCKMLKKKILNQEYPGLQGIKVGAKDLKTSSCSEGITSMKFIVDPKFKKL